MQLCGYTIVCLSRHPQWTLVISLTNTLCANDEASMVFAAGHMIAVDTVEPGPQRGSTTEQSCRKNVSFLFEEIIIA